MYFTSGLPTSRGPAMTVPKMRTKIFWNVYWPPLYMRIEKTVGPILGLPCLWKLPFAVDRNLTTEVTETRIRKRRFFKTFRIGLHGNHVALQYSCSSASHTPQKLHTPHASDWAYNPLHNPSFHFIFHFLFHLTIHYSSFHFIFHYPHITYNPCEPRCPA